LISEHVQNDIREALEYWGYRRITSYFLDALEELEYELHNEGLELDVSYDVTRNMFILDAKETEDSFWSFRPLARVAIEYVTFEEFSISKFMAQMKHEISNFNQNCRRLVGIIEPNYCID